MCLFIMIRVKLLVHQKTNEELALKIVDLKKHKDAQNSVNKEVRIHKCLNHPNIIKFFGFRPIDDNLCYIFLEFASGGELFNRIGLL